MNKNEFNGCGGCGKFFIIPTPIGNMDDITLRALNTLKSLDILLCEDTRVTCNILKYYNIHIERLMVYNDHSSTHDRENIVELLVQGKNIGIVSDAGTPIVSDPGYKLLQALRARDVYVTCLPGACAVITAVVASNLPSSNFAFHGFLPRKEQEIKNEISRIVNSRNDDVNLHVYYESCHRIMSTLELLAHNAQITANAQVCVAREMTKKFEDVKAGNVVDILQYYAANPDKVRGEIVLLIYYTPPINQDNAARIDNIYGKMLDAFGGDLPKNAAAKFIAKELGLSKKIVYDHIH